MEPTDSLIFPDKVIVYGTFWQRFAASFLDGLIIGIPLFAINFMLGMGPMTRFSINGIVGWIYSASLESGPNQATLGKKAMGLIVTDESGRRISFGQATARHFSKLISMVILCIGYLMMLWDKRSQTLHDKIAGTLVTDRALSRNIDATL
jgi:uncharacterized RDD family membrane protein YckC